MKYLKEFLIGASYFVFLPFFFGVYNTQTKKTYNYYDYTLIAPVWFGFWNVMSLIIAKKYKLSKRYRYLTISVISSIAVMLIATHFKSYEFDKKEWEEYYVYIFIKYLLVWNVVIFYLDKYIDTSMNKSYIFAIIAILSLIVYVFINYDQIKIHILNTVIVSRGIISPNCFWYKISDLILYDGAGVELYNKYKNKYGDFALTTMFNEKIYLVTNKEYIKTILDDSPDIFSVGNLKKKFFDSFMGKNVGVSTGCPWKKRRYINEYALNTDMLHIYSSKYNDDLRNNLIQLKDKNVYTYDDFVNLGKLMASEIVFNTKKVDDNVFNLFKEANNIDVFSSNKFSINQKVYDNYINVLKYYIRNPNDKSLVKLLLDVTNNEDEIIHQIPHFIFPIVGLYVTTVPRLLVLLFNHKPVLDKLVKEINSIDDDGASTDSKAIYKLSYLRKCILETLRLNNPVITTFRTLTQDFSFDNKYNFKKGTQFIILNNPVLREKEFYIEPNKFIPSRWTPEMEKSYYAISFNQGPQRCPGKELAIYLVQSFIYNFIKIKNISSTSSFKTKYIDTDNIPQIINPCTIEIEID